MALRRLRADNDTHRAPRQIHDASVARVLPTPLRAATLRLVAFDEDVVQSLGLAPEALADEAFTECFTGRRLLPGSSPYSHVYVGNSLAAGRASWATAAQRASAIADSVAKARSTFSRVERSWMSTSAIGSSPR